MLRPSDKTQKMLFGWATRKKPLAKVTPAEDPTRHPFGTPSSNGASSKVVSLARESRRGFSWSEVFSLPRVMAVVLVVSGIYFFGVARDRYVSESDFVVRRADDAGQGLTGVPLANLLGASSQNSLEDARYLRVYLSSPQVLQDLMKVYDFDKAYSRDQSDPFTGLPEDVSREARLKFFQKQVQVVLDENSGVISLVTVGLSPESALKLNRFLLQKSEEFVNRLNQNIGVKQLEFAEQELTRARRPLEQAKEKLVQYQSAAQVVDAKEEAKATTAVIASMEKKLGELKVELFTLQQQYKSPDEPEVLVVADQVSQLQRLIDKERKGVVSSTGRNLTRKAADQLKLESEVEFATDLYKTALVASEKARVETRRQQKFMAILSSPLSADSPAKNWRYRGFFTVVALVLVAVSLTKFVLGMQASHRE